MPSNIDRIFSKPSGSSLPASDPVVIAEMAWSHDGKLELGERIVDAAAQAGAEAINLHVTHLPSYMTPTYGANQADKATSVTTSDVYRYLEGLNPSFEMIEKLVGHARRRQLAVSCMPNDRESLNFVLSKCKPELITIHPSCILEEDFVRAAAAPKTGLILYTGGLSLGEIDRTIGWAAAEGNERIVLQHGFQSYPTPIEYNRLRYIGTLKRLFGRPVCFADHTDGADPMALILPLLAVCFGADAVEKHLTHDRSLKGEDYEAALDPADFAVFVERLRLSARAFGSEAVSGLSEPEQRYRRVVRKKAVFARSGKQGEVLSEALVTFKRADEGLYPEDVAPLLGTMKLGRDVAPNEPVVWSAFAL